MEAIKLRREGPVARLVLNQPRKRNAINRSMWRSLARFAGEIASDASVRVVTLESAVAGCFAAGADISEFAENYADAETTAEVNAEIYQAIDSVANCPQPSLALIDGVCVGGGLALVLACDFRLCSEAASFAFTPSRLGLSCHPADARRLISAVGRGAASELLFSASMWPASRALQTGLVNSVFDKQAFNPESQKVVEEMCSSSLSSNRVIKQTIQDVESASVNQYARAEQAFTAQFSSADFKEGRDAFLSKRKARFPSHEIKTD